MPCALGHNVDVPGLDQVFCDGPRRADDDFVHPLARAYIKHPLVQCHHWVIRALGTTDDQVVLQAYNQERAKSPSILQKLSMPHVEHVEGAAAVDDTIVALRLSSRCKFHNAPSGS